ncbi:MAG: MbnH family di-heme enzyme [Myxococcota bacterium]
MAFPGRLSLLFCLAAFWGCGGDSDEAMVDPQGWEWNLPEGFPEPRVPANNPMTNAKVELGRFLFYDTRLSLNETQSCGSCHQQDLAFTDGLALAEGSTGEIHPRGSMGLVNVAYQATLTWANPLLNNLEEQALLPIFGESPIVELGMAGQEELLVERLTADARYPAMFAEAFPDEPAPITVQNVVRSLGAFQRSIISADSPYDRGELTESARRGAELFFGEKFDCFHCHGSFNFSSSVDHSGVVFEEAVFFNNGLYNVDGRGAYPPENTGIFEITGGRADMGRFKPPTLRNIAVTGPYMHDGSVETLEDVLAVYAAAGRNVTEGPYVGDGRENPNKNIFVHGFDMTPEEQADMLEFLRSLTDETVLTDPRWSDPFQ